MKYNTAQLKYLFLLSAVLLISCNRNFSRLPKDENRYNLTREIDLRYPTYAKEIETFYEWGTEGYFTGQEDVQIYYRVFEQSVSEKAILISSGRTEAVVKYKELIFDLYKNGYSVYVHDHRGQGQSSRLTEDPDMGYVDRFQYYIDDMKYFYDHYLKPGKYKKTYLLAHSMGGAIGMIYLEQHPDDFNAAAFSSPMLGFNPGICSAVRVLGSDDPEYAMGESGYADDKSNFQGNTLTGSRIRYERMVDAFAEVPEARLGGATYQWLTKSCQQFEYLFQNIGKLRTPFVLFSPENEQIVNPRAHQKFVEAALKLGKECLAFEVEDAQHELFIEKDEARLGTINRTLDFFSQN